MAVFAIGGQRAVDIVVEPSPTGPCIGPAALASVAVTFVPSSAEKIMP